HGALRYLTRQSVLKNIRNFLPAFGGHKIFLKFFFGEMIVSRKKSRDVIESRKIWLQTKNLYLGGIYAKKNRFNIIVNRLSNVRNRFNVQSTLCPNGFKRRFRRGQCDVSPNHPRQCR